MSKEKRDRDRNVVQTLKDSQSLHKILERNAELVVRGTKLRQTWGSNIGKKEFRMLLFMRSIRSSSPNEYSYKKANQWAGLAQRDKISLYGELELKKLSSKKIKQKTLKI